jgi:hypothetical protein
MMSTRCVSSRKPTIEKALLPDEDAAGKEENNMHLKGLQLRFGCYHNCR